MLLNTTIVSYPHRKRMLKDAIRISLDVRASGSCLKSEDLPTWRFEFLPTILSHEHYSNIRKPCEEYPRSNRSYGRTNFRAVNASA
jgi:hypothetical protein